MAIKFKRGFLDVELFTAGSSAASSHQASFAKASRLIMMVAARSVQSFDREPIGEGGQQP